MTFILNYQAALPVLELEINVTLWDKLLVFSYMSHVLWC